MKHDNPKGIFFNLTIFPTTTSMVSYWYIVNTKYLNACSPFLYVVATSLFFRQSALFKSFLAHCDVYNVGTYIL